MSATHKTGVYNVRASLVAWLAGELTTYLPSTVPTMRLNLDHPEEPINPPEWSIHWLGEPGSIVPFSGGHVGGGEVGRRRYGLMDINCWVTRKDVQWRAQISQMQDAVSQALTNSLRTGSSIAIQDFYTNADAPADSGYLIFIDEWGGRESPLDPNPDIQRKRIVVQFNWIERA